MTRLSPFFAVAALGGVLTFTGCGRGTGHTEENGHNHGGAAPEAPAAPARFKEGQGLWLAERTRQALGLEMAEAEERALAPVYEATATVFDAGPPARASAFVPPAIAAALERHPPPGAGILAVRRDLVGALGQVELVVAVPGAPAVGTTVALRLEGPPRPNLTVPHSALLRTATGTFVYVVNGDHLLRTPVQLGSSDGAVLEILDGLYAGDVVATAAVEQLWLTELRLTKGGGHSH